MSERYVVMHWCGEDLPYTVFGPVKDGVFDSSVMSARFEHCDSALDYAAWKNGVSSPASLPVVPTFLAPLVASCVELARVCAEVKGMPTAIPSRLDQAICSVVGHVSGLPAIDQGLTVSPGVTVVEPGADRCPFKVQRNNDRQDWNVYWHCKPGMKVLVCGYSDTNYGTNARDQAEREANNLNARWRDDPIGVSRAAMGQSERYLKATGITH